MDAAEVISGGINIPEIPILSAKGKVPVHMKQGGSWRTSSNVLFTVEQPYQLLEPTEAMNLVAENPERFEMADVEEIRAFYKLQ